MDYEPEKVEAFIAELRAAAERGDPTDPIIAAHSVAVQSVAMIELFNSGEYELMTLALSRDHVHDMRPTGIPGMGIYAGHDEYSRFVRDWVDTFPGAQLELQLIFEIPERGAVFGVTHQEVRGGASQVPTSFQYAYVAERTPERSTSAFGLDLEAMREDFVARYGQDPGPIPARPKSKQEA